MANARRPRGRPARPTSPPAPRPIHTPLSLIDDATELTHRVAAMLLSVEGLQWEMENEADRARLLPMVRGLLELGNFVAEPLARVRAALDAHVAGSSA